MKILPVGDKLFYANGRKDRADMVKLTVAFRNSLTRPKQAIDITNDFISLVQ